MEEVHGAAAGRELNRRVGQLCLNNGLRDFNPLLGIADLPVRMMPLSLKLHVRSICSPWSSTAFRTSASRSVGITSNTTGSSSVARCAGAATRTRRAAPGGRHSTGGADLGDRRQALPGGGDELHRARRRDVHDRDRQAPGGRRGRPT